MTSSTPPLCKITCVEALTHCITLRHQRETLVAVLLSAGAASCDDSSVRESKVLGYVAVTQRAS